MIKLENSSGSQALWGMPYARQPYARQPYARRVPHVTEKGYM